MTRGVQIDRCRRSLALAAIGAFCGLALAGCSAEAEAPTPITATMAGTGTLETSVGLYTFTPTTCVIYQSTDGDDIEVQGPGTAPDGEAFFFELSSTANALTIGLGVEGPFASPERRLKAGRFASREFVIVATEQGLSAAGLVLVDEHGAAVDGNAALNIDCGR